MLAPWCERPSRMTLIGGAPRHRWWARRFPAAQRRFGSCWPRHLDALCRAHRDYEWREQGIAARATCGGLAPVLRGRSHPIPRRGARHLLKRRGVPIRFGDLRARRLRISSTARIGGARDVLPDLRGVRRDGGASARAGRGAASAPATAHPALCRAAWRRRVRAATIRQAVAATVRSGELLNAAYALHPRRSARGPELGADLRPPSRSFRP
jgi:hypothetical protein